jgi:hypothetical protein
VRGNPILLQHEHTFPASSDVQRGGHAVQPATATTMTSDIPLMLHVLG